MLSSESQFSFLLLHATTIAPRLLSTRHSLFFACLASPNARYSTHHIGLSIAPQTCRPSFRTLQSFLDQHLHTPRNCPPLCRRTESDQLYAHSISGCLKNEPGNNNSITGSSIQRREKTVLGGLGEKSLRLSILGFGNFKHYHGIIFRSRHFPPRCTYRSHSRLSQYQFFLYLARS